VVLPIDKRREQRPASPDLSHARRVRVRERESAGVFLVGRQSASECEHPLAPPAGATRVYATGSATTFSRLRDSCRPGEATTLLFAGALADGGEKLQRAGSSLRNYTAGTHNSTGMACAKLLTGHKLYFQNQLNFIL